MRSRPGGSQGGSPVTLLEKTDQLLGTGLVGGIMNNNGRYTAAEEAIALGGGSSFQIAYSVARHRNINFPGHRHATLYDVTKIEPAVRRFLQEKGIDIQLETRAGAVEMEEGRGVLRAFALIGIDLAADVFETTGRQVPGQLFEIRQWLCHVYPPLSQLRAPGQHRRPGRGSRNDGRQCCRHPGGHEPVHVSC